MRAGWTGGDAAESHADAPASLDRSAWESPAADFYHYAIYGIHLRSQIRFSFEQAPRVENPDIDLRVAPPQFFREAVANAELKTTPSGWYRYAQLSNRAIYLIWEDLFEFLVQADGRRVWCGWLGSKSLESLQVYLLGHALSFALVTTTEFGQTGPT